MMYKIAVDLEHYHEELLAILRSVVTQPTLSHKQLLRQLKTHLKDDGSFFGFDDLILAYRTFAGTDDLPAFDPLVLDRLRLKPVRSGSGVAVVTVLTKPFPCPGECIFCPNDVPMPKSYLSDEPGAQRAEQNGFDPYLQTYSRLLALYKTGHPLDTIEVIILGGTWSFYPESYQLWFVRRIFDALHDFGDGLDNRAEVQALLDEQSGITARDDGLIQIDGIQFERTYNQAVQTIYREDLRRARHYADAIAEGTRQRSPIDEFATWAELEAAHRQNEEAECRWVGMV